MQRTDQMKLTDSDPSPVYDTTDIGIAQFRQMVIENYRNHGRNMQWRETTDPYQILVSEIMLQQTQVERVKVKFPEFIAAFPDFKALAGAPLTAILSAWQGMGYNRRAIALQKCAARVMTEYGGTLPSDPVELATFPGIGDATASSICAFAFNLPVVFIETNIRRVFIHYFFSDSAKVSDAEILTLVKKAIWTDNPRVWYWALMDLGTVLKKTVSNPNRRSVHYTKQSAFEGSDRKIRGEILRCLLPGNGMTREEILGSFPEDPSRISGILEGLERDGFIVPDGNRIRLSS
ncbi:A/G-specific adenine glycosylase [uncultured Methanoregula sp.]|uniref:A/G-specific adenine glycosylase n=1 Tax=uncultured Methanoregula sp. TaxID=1005933 RepID=UPI002AABA06C|nr:A/G-specific adenine glycosylase [uncultured Methanoregula sp.]